MWRNSSCRTNMKTWCWSRINLSYWPWFCSVFYCNMLFVEISFSFLFFFFFYCNLLAFVVRPLYFHCCEWWIYTSGEYCIQTFDRPTIIFSTILYLQWIQCTIYSPYYCKLSLFFFYVIAKLIYLVTIYFLYFIRFQNTTQTSQVMFTMFFWVTKA